MKTWSETFQVDAMQGVEHIFIHMVHFSAIYFRVEFSFSPQLWRGQTLKAVVQLIDDWWKPGLGKHWYLASYSDYGQ